MPFEKTSNTSQIRHLQDETALSRISEMQNTFARRKSQELSPRSEITARSSKRVSICDSEARSMLSKRNSSSTQSSPRTMRDFDKALNNEQVYAYLRDVVRSEFPNGTVECDIVKENHYPSETSFDKTLRFTGGDKKIYVNLRHLLSISHTRPTPYKNFYDGKETEVGTLNSPLSNSHTTSIGNLTSRSDSNISTTRTSVLEELKSVQQLLKLKPNDGDRSQTLSHTISSSWARQNNEKDGKNNADFEPVYSTLKKNVNTSSESVDPRTGIQLERIKLDDFNSNVPELIDVVRWKIELQRVLDWADLFILKTFHCQTVNLMEKELFTLQSLSGYSESQQSRVADLREELNEEYTVYEKILEGAHLVESNYTFLAHKIVLADAYLFHARITKNDTAKQLLYRQSINTYNILMDKAQTSLPVDDVSVLTIADKISLILRESRNFDPDLVLKTALLVDKAEKKLERNAEAEARRKILQVKHNLSLLNEYCQVPV